MTNKSMVLYVDDNPRSRRLLTSLLQDCGVEVVAIEDPNEALELSRTNPFNLAVLDYHMASMTGAELAQKIKSLQPDMPVILISGSTSPQPHELLSVDVHFGAGTSLGDLFDTVRRLVELNTIRIANGTQPAYWGDST